MAIQVKQCNYLENPRQNVPIVTIFYDFTLHSGKKNFEVGFTPMARKKSQSNVFQFARF